MTRLAASIMVHSLEQALAMAALAAEQGADLVEFRIDQYHDPAGLTQLVERSPLPCIITCRTSEEGGQYDGDEQARIALLEHACLGQRAPAYLDVELASWQRSANLRQKVALVVDHPGQVRPTSTGLILSAHDFTGRPADLLQRVEAMAAAPACRVIKVVWMARSLRDNLEAFELIGQQYKPTIALCMGPFGLPSRLLAKKFGALLTFATVHTHEPAATAPGQPTLREVKQLYRWDHLNPATQVFGVIGYPVEHSLSPHVHNAGFDELGYDGVYLPLPIPPEYEHFKATVSAWLEAPNLHFRGASVTIPHKENLLRFVRQRGGEIEPLAQRIGAANTLLVRDDGSLAAFNTDYPAALDAIGQALSISRRELAGLRVAVLGAGGAARAVVAGLAHHGATVVIYNRTPGRAEQLAGEFADMGGKVVAAPWQKLCDSCCQVIVNCTPVGMHPNVQDTPLPRPRFEAGTVVFDTIYNPLTTRLLREARAAGCVTIPGLEMFVRQAAGQFTLWTGADAPIDRFRKVLTDRLTG